MGWHFKLNILKNQLKNFLINKNSNINQALNKLNYLGQDAILFVVDDQNRLIGSLTDGDVRRGLIRGINTKDKVDSIIQKNPKFLIRDNFDILEMINPF